MVSESLKGIDSLVLLWDCTGHAECFVLWIWCCYFIINAIRFHNFFKKELVLNKQQTRAAANVVNREVLQELTLQSRRRSPSGSGSLWWGRCRLVCLSGDPPPVCAWCPQRTRCTRRDVLDRHRHPTENRSWKFINGMITVFFLYLMYLSKISWFGLIKGAVCKF